jgi:hypothetical protein
MNDSFGMRSMKTARNLNSYIKNLAWAISGMHPPARGHAAYCVWVNPEATYKGLRVVAEGKSRRGVLSLPIKEERHSQRLPESAAAGNSASCTQYALCQCQRVKLCP